MRINDEYNLTSDALNWILQKRFEKKKKKGEEDKPTEYGWKDIAFFPNPHMALKYMVDRDIRETGLEDFKMVLDKIEELHKVIESLNLD